MSMAKNIIEFVVGDLGDKKRWREYKDTRSVRISSLTLVKGTGERWIDLAPVTLGEPSK